MSTREPHYHYAQQTVARRRYAMTVILAQRRKSNALELENEYNCDIVPDEIRDDLKYFSSKEVNQQVMLDFDEAMTEPHEKNETGRPQGRAEFTCRAAGTLRAHGTGGVDRQSPPKLAQYLLYLFLSREEREAMLGCLEEDYQTNLLPKFGTGWANLWYCWEVGRSIVPVICEATKRVWWFIKKFTS